MLRTKTSIAIAIPALLLCLASSASFAQTPQKISFGSISNTAINWPTFVGDREGFFKKEGVALDVVNVGNVANAAQQLVGGAFDAAVSTFDTALRAAAKSGNVVLIGGMTVKFPYSIMAAKEIHTARDLVGKKVILPFPKDFVTIIWNRWLTKQGVQPTAIDQVYDGSTPNRFNALVSGAVQATVVNQPFDFRLQDQGYVKLLDIGAASPDFGFLVILARRQWLKDKPDTGRAMLRAYSEAIDWLYDPANKARAIEILEQETRAEPQIAAQTYDYYINDLKPFAVKTAIPADVVQNTLDTLIAL
jgi:NitT/TauT family transport system substrate-binding protein